MDFTERNKLINELKARGFEEYLERENFGWIFEHGNGFRVYFDARVFRFFSPGNPIITHAATEAQTVLDLVDQAMSEF